MSTASRYAWRDQQATLTERMRGFLENPGDTELDAVLIEMHAYAEAAQSGNIEIPQRWISVS